MKTSAGKSMARAARLADPLGPLGTVSAQARVPVPSGAAISYGLRHRVEHDTWIATVPAGYADGVPVSATAHADKPGGSAIVGGVRCPFVGRVSMDSIILDVTDAPLALAQRGGWAEILGLGIGVDELAGRAGVIGYEILTRLGRRYARRYV